MAITSSSELDFLSAFTVMPMRVVVSTLRLILRRQSVLSRSRAWLWSAVSGSAVIFSNCLRIRMTSSSTDEDMTTSHEAVGRDDGAGTADSICEEVEVVD